MYSPLTPESSPAPEGIMSQNDVIKTRSQFPSMVDNEETSQHKDKDVILVHSDTGATSQNLTSFTLANVASNDTVQNLNKSSIMHNKETTKKTANDVTDAQLDNGDTSHNGTVFIGEYAYKRG